MSGSVITFPNCARVTKETVPLAVVVAPRNSNFVAWVQTAKGWVILEDSPSASHAFEDGYAYAARHDVPFRHQNHPLDTAKGYRGAKRGGTVGVAPSERSGGSWDVLHVSADGAEASILTNRFALDEAEAAARQCAKEMRATYRSIEPGPSAA